MDFFSSSDSESDDDDEDCEPDEDVSELDPVDGEREAFFAAGLSFTGEAADDFGLSTLADTGVSFLLGWDGGGGRGRGGEGVGDLRLDLEIGCSCSARPL